MKHLSDAELYSRIIARMRAAEKEGEEKNILDSLSNGRNSYMRLDRLESSSYDPSWIDEIEGVLFDLGDIINVPRLSTKTIGDISPIELAKKVTGESVQHLASHTQYIKEVDDYGNVIPSKIMSFSNEDDYLTYENRFIATFIRKLILFVEKRYEYVSKFAQLHDEEVLYLKNRSIVHGADVSIETKIKVISDSETQSAKENNAYFLRISEVRRYLHYYYASPFMKLFKTEKNVRNPILQTNIIRKNVKYHHCYEVYRYIERFENLGVSYKVDETYSQFTPEELRELNYSLLASYLALRGKDKSEHTKVASKVYKPKILTSMDDESFLYNDYLKGPVQFVRTDEGYREFLGHLEPKDLPEEPTPAEKEYYKEEYEAKEDLRRFDEELAALLARKQEEGAAFEEKANAILAKREQERLRLLELERKVVEREQQEMLNRIRAEIILNAREYGDEYVPMPLPEESAKRMEEAMHPTYDGESILRDSKRDYPYRDDNLRPATEQSMEDLEEAYMKELEDILDFEARERKRLEEEKKAQEEAEKAALEQFEATAGEESQEEAEAEEEAQEGEEAAAGEEAQEESAPEEGQEEAALGESQEEPAPEEESAEEKPLEGESAGEEQQEGESQEEEPAPAPASAEESQEEAPSESQEEAPAETEAGIVLGVDSSHPEDQKQPKEQEEPASSEEEHLAEEPAKKKQKKPFVLRERPHVKLRRKPEYAIPAPAEEEKNESEDDEVIVSSDAPLDSDLEIRDIPDEPVKLADIEQRQEEYPEYVPPENAAEMPIIPDAFEAEDHLDIPMEEEGENEPQEEEVAQEENPAVEAPAAEEPIEEEATPVSDFPEIEEEPAAEETQEEAEEPAPEEEPEAVEEEPSVTDAPEEEAADQIEEEPAAEEEPEAVEEVPEIEEVADLPMEDATPVSDFPAEGEEPATEEEPVIEEEPEDEEAADLLMEEATLASDFPEVEEEPATEEEPEAMEEEPSEEQTDLPEEPEEAPAEEEPVIEEEPENEEVADLPMEEEATPVVDFPEVEEEPTAEEAQEEAEEEPLEEEPLEAESEEVADLPMEEDATPVADLPEEEAKEQPAVDMPSPRKKRRKKKKHHKHSDQPREPRVIRGRPKIKLRIKR